MRVYIKKFTALTVVAIAMTIFTSSISAQVRAYRVSDRQVQTLINRIENRADTFKNRLDRALDRSAIDGTRQEDRINYMVEQFEIATNRLKSNFEGRRSTAADVQEVLMRAVPINRFMLNNNLQRNAQQPWNLLRADLNTLAGYYNVRADWNAANSFPGQQPVYRVTDREVQAVIHRLESNTDRFKNQIGRALNNSGIDGSNREDSINSMIGAFETATNRLKDNFNGRRSTAVDAQDVFNRGALVDRFVRSNRLPNQATNTWTQIRGDLNTLAGYYNVAANWNYVGTPTGPVYAGGYIVTDAQMRTLLNRLRTNTSDFRTRYTRWNMPWRRNQAGPTDISQHLVDLDRHLNDLTNNYNRASISDVEELLRTAAIINSEIAANRPNNDLFNRWGLVRNDLSTLASNYRMSWDWNNPINTGGQWAGGSFDTQLTGSYRLNASLSDNVSMVVDRAIINARYNNNRPNLKNNLERRLGSPQMIDLEKRNSQVTMSTGNQTQVNFSADGNAQTETSPNGRTVTTRVVSTNRDLTISYEGDRMNDYYVSFMPMNNGQLRVTRRVYIENQNETVTVNSVYDKISPTPQWSTVAGRDWTGGNTGGFIIPNNTTIVASLNTPLSTGTARDGDRFSMTVDAPGQYNGAIIEGRVIGERSGVVTGRANMSLSFETIRLRNGQTHQFAGLVNQVRQTNGDSVTVNNEGNVQDSSQTTRTVTRAGIGAVLGAIIGAIAGGGEGAAIGAGVGAGAGAGTVILQGRDNLELGAGTQFTITATAPANIGMR
ncbi:hypothetical protein BH20ACI2_BH20ACI2_17830 [soil metagenome]